MRAWRTPYFHDTMPEEIATECCVPNEGRPRFIRVIRDFYPYFFAAIDLAKGEMGYSAKGMAPRRDRLEHLLVLANVLNDPTLRTALIKKEISERNLMIAAAMIRRARTPTVFSTAGAA